MQGEDKLDAGRPNAAQATKADPYFGRMTDPSGSAFVRGLCGDEMEFYLVVEDKTFKEAV